MSQAKAELLKQLIDRKQALRGLRDLWFFDKYILGYKDMTARDRFHGEMCDFVEDPDHDAVLTMLPRGALKSSVITIGYSTREIVKDPNIRILLCSEEFMTAQKFMAEIKGHLEHNKKFIRLYGELKPKSKQKWSEKEIIVRTRTKWRKEPTITCAGIDVTKVGLHYDLIIVDDAHSTKNTTSREQIEKVKAWYRLLLSLLDPGGKLIVIGTRWHYDDLYGWLIEQEKVREAAGLPQRFHIMVKEACGASLNYDTPDEELLWPERLSKEFLISQKLDQGPYIFSCQYRNEPVDDESATFKKSWLRFYHPEELPKKVTTYTTVDPIRDADGGDYVAIVTVSVDAHWRHYIRDVRRGKWDDHEVLDQLWDIWKIYKPQRMGVESVAWQKTYYKYLKQEQLRRGYKMPIVELKTDSKISKKLRIRGLVPFFKAGLFLFPGESLALLKGDMAILADELLRYPRVEHDDCADGLAYITQLTRPPLISHVMKSLPKNSFFGKRKEIIRAKKKGRLGLHNVA